METDVRNEPLHSFRVLPDTCTEFFVSYRQSALAHIPGKTSAGNSYSFVVSRMTHFMDVHMQAGMGCIAVCFHPGAAHFFFPMPMNEITDNLVALHDLWKHAANEMEEQVALAVTNEERVSIIQQFLLQQLYINKKTEDKRLQHCLWQINLFKGQLSVSELSEHANLGKRQLNRHFTNCTGLSPKEYAKVTRFIYSLTHLKKYPALSLTEIAYESGYYDQAHFIHDYQQYSGLTPKELVTANNVLF